MEKLQWYQEQVNNQALSQKQKTKYQFQEISKLLSTKCEPTRKKEIKRKLQLLR
jgi:hypothetical protein